MRALGRAFVRRVLELGTARIILVGRKPGTALDVHGLRGLLRGSPADDGIAGLVEELDLAQAEEMKTCSDELINGIPSWIKNWVGIRYKN